MYISVVVCCGRGPAHTDPDEALLLRPGCGRARRWLPGACGRPQCPATKQRRLTGVEMTLARVCPPEYWGAQFAFKDSMVH